VSNRKLLLAASRDGGHNFGDWREGHVGEVGEYDVPVRFLRFGSARDFRVKVRITSPIRVDVLGLLVDAEAGE
jgi:hypothetical protein